MTLADLGFEGGLIGREPGMVLGKWGRRAPDKSRAPAVSASQIAGLAGIESVDADSESCAAQPLLHLFGGLEGI